MTPTDPIVIHIEPDTTRFVAAIERVQRSLDRFEARMAARHAAARARRRRLHVAYRRRQLARRRRNRR